MTGGRVASVAVLITKLAGRTVLVQSPEPSVKLATEPVSLFVQSAL